MKTVRRISILFLCVIMLGNIGLLHVEAKTNIKLNKTKVNLSVGKSTTLKLEQSKVEKWTTSNKKIATVSSKGKVTGKKKGTATITAKATNGKNYKCTVTVKKVTPEPTPKPEQPSVSADTVKANIESGLRSAGLITIGESVEQLYNSGAITEDDYNLIQSTAPTYGAGWFIGYESSSGGASAIVNTYKDYGYQYYYIEYLGQEDGQYKFKCYYDYD